MKKKREVPEGVKIEVTHMRRFVSYLNGEEMFSDFGDRDDVFEMNPRGGYTVADAFDSEGNPIDYAIAACSNRDNYSKKLGRNIAVGRLLKKLEDAQTI